MPAMVRIGPAKGYKLPPLKKDASREEADAHKALTAAWEQVKAGGAKEVTAVGANEALQYGRGMYEIVPAEAAPVTATAIRMPEDMTADELKLTALQLGVDLRKPMKKADLVAAVRKAMDAVELLEDEDSEDET
jgi:hypothetical protein